MSRNRTAGNNYELFHVHKLKEVGYQAASSRLESRSLDAQKVDIVSDCPFYIQCKLTQNTPNIKEIFDAMPDGKFKVIAHGKTIKKKTRIFKEADYIYMEADTFYKLLKLIKDNNLQL